MMSQTKKFRIITDDSTILFILYFMDQTSKKPPAVAPSRWVRYGSAGTEHVTAIAHVIVRHEQLTGKGLEVT